MNIRNKLSVAVSGVIAVAFGVSLPAEHSAAQGESADNRIEEVVVTARKREERLQDVPIAVSAISADMIERQQINSIREIAAFAPGLQINSDGVNRAFISIRGIGTTLIDSVQPGVGIFIDGIYQPNTSYLNNPVLDVERIEVLKGPQGTLFGNNTLGGAINVVTRAPTDEVSGRVSAVYGDDDAYQTVAGSISGPLIEGVLRGRVAASYHSEDGFSENLLVGGDARALEQRALNGTLLWDPSETVAFTLNGYYNKVEGSSNAYSNLEGPRDYRQDVTLNVNSAAEFDYWGLNLRSAFELEAMDTELTVILAYDDKEGTGEGDTDFGPVDFARARGQKNSLETKTVELRFDTQWTENVSTLLGLFSNQVDGTNFSLTDLPLFGISGIPSSVESELSAEAIFGTLFWDISESTEVTLGLRYDRQEVRGEDMLTGFKSSYSADEFQPRITLSHHVDPALMTYASISRGFRGGGTNGPGAPNPIYEGDSVWSYEVGSKLSSEDQRLTLNVAAYYNDYEDYIGQNALAQADSGGLIAINLNSGDVESYGAEIEVSWQATDRFSLQGGVSLNHTRITDGSQYAETTGFELPSDRILFLPDWNFSTTASYVIPLGADSLRLDATVIGKGDRVGSTLSKDSIPELEAYTLLNANIAWEHDNWTVALWGTNLTDESYFESYIDQSLLISAGLPPFLWNNLGIANAERRVGIRITANF